MKLIIPFLIIGSLAILQTAAVPLCICSGSPHQIVRRMHSLPRKYRIGQKVVSGPDNVQAGSLAPVGQEAASVPQEKAGEDSRVVRFMRRSQSQPVSGPDNVEVPPPVRKEEVGIDNPGGGGPTTGRSPSQPTRVFSGEDSSQPEYVDLEDMRFLYGN